MVLMIPSITAQQHLVSNANVLQKCGDQKETESVPISIHVCLSDQPSAKGQRLNWSKLRVEIKGRNLDFHEKSYLEDMYSF